MKMQFSPVLPIFSLVVILIMVSGCESTESEEESIVKPTLLLNQVIEITINSAICESNVLSNGGADVTQRGVVWGISESPNLTKKIGYTEDGVGVGTYNSSVIALEERTTYFIRAYAVNSAGIAYSNSVSFETLRDSANTFTDLRDGNVYKTVTIDGKVWMAENLKYLPLVSPPDSFSRSEAHYYVHGYVGDDVDKAKAEETFNTYGVLYNWQAATAGQAYNFLTPDYDIPGVCPSGWHLPSSMEWIELLRSVGENAANKLKESGTVNWGALNTDANNETKFTALPGGYLSGINGFTSIGVQGFWWTANRLDQTVAFTRMMERNEANVKSAGSDIQDAISVRCIKDD